MKKLKVITAIGTRPEIIRLSRVIDLLDKNLKPVLIILYVVQLIQKKFYIVSNF